jgi:hypothetical protein
LVAVFGPNDLDRIVPAEQADFGNVGPMAIGLPKRLAAIRATRGRGDFALGEFLLETRIGPYGLAFIA